MQKSTLGSDASRSILLMHFMVKFACSTSVITLWHQLLIILQSPTILSVFCILAILGVLLAEESMMRPTKQSIIISHPMQYNTHIRRIVRLQRPWAQLYAWVASFPVGLVRSCHLHHILKYIHRAPQVLRAGMRQRWSPWRSVCFSLYNFCGVLR